MAASKVSLMCAEISTSCASPVFITSFTSSPVAHANSRSLSFSCRQRVGGCGGWRLTGGLQPHVHLGLRRVGDGVAAEVHLGAAQSRAEPCLSARQGLGSGLGQSEQSDKKVRAKRLSGGTHLRMSM